MSLQDQTARIAALGETARLECRICWYLYDPAAGDPMEQVAPGTPFTALPSHWRCPQCDAAQEMFVPVEDERD